MEFEPPLIIIALRYQLITPPFRIQEHLRRSEHPAILSARGTIHSSGKKAKLVIGDVGSFNVKESFNYRR
jgi:hypothetical protein